MSEKTPLTMREHYALRQMAAALSGITTIAPVIERRMNTVPDGWQRFCELKTAVETVFDLLIKTIPEDKLTRLKMELDNTRYDLYTDAIKTTKRDTGYVCIEEKTLIKIVSILQDQCCDLCDKTGKDVKKCKIRKAIAETINFATPGMTTDNCVWAVNSIDGVTGRLVEGGGDG